jgi:hypothetical protein
MEACDMADETDKPCLVFPTVVSPIIKIVCTSAYILKLDQDPGHTPILSDAVMPFQSYALELNSHFQGS